MEIAGDMAGERLNPLEKAITQVAALLHDLGKLRAVGSGSTRPTHYLLVRHESQTTRMLDPHLEWLRARSPQIAAGLDYTLEFLAQHPAERGRALFLASDVVCAADRMSAALDNHKDLDNLLAKTLPKQQPKAPEADSTHALRSTPRTNATNHQLDIVARHETNAAHRARHQPNNHTQEGPLPMDLSIWSFTPLVAAPAAAIVLVTVLRRLLQFPASAGAADHKAQSGELEADNLISNKVAAADAIDAHWNPLVTQVLPFFVGAAILFLAAWPFAYVGWMLMHTVGDPEIVKLSPPWFGNPGYLLGFGLIGVMCSLAIAFVAGIVFLLVYLLGRCAIWPQACAGSSNEQDQEAA